MAANRAKCSDALNVQELARLETPLCSAKTENPCFGVCGKARLLPYEAKAGGDMRSKNKWV